MHQIENRYVCVVFRLVREGSVEEFAGNKDSNTFIPAHEMKTAKSCAVSDQKDPRRKDVKM